MHAHRCLAHLASRAVLVGLILAACGGADVGAPEPDTGTQPAKTTTAPAPVAPAGPAALVAGDGGSGIEALRASVRAATDLDDLLVKVQGLTGDASLTLTSVPSRAKGSVGDDATWLAVSVPEALSGRDVDIAAWRASLAAGVLRDVAADRGWSVPAGVSESLGEGGAGDGVGLRMEPGSVDRPTLAIRPLPATAAEAESAIREGVAEFPGLTLESLDFISSLSPVPVLRLRTEEPRKVLPEIGSLQLGAGRFDFEGWWLELRDAAGEVIFIHMTARRMGGGGTYIEPSLEHLVRGHG